MKRIVTAILATTLIFTLTTATFASESSSDFTVQTTGDVTLSVDPDIAYINLGVSTFGKTSKDATAENTKITENLINSLVDTGIAKEDIQTQYYGVYPNYNFSETGVESISGYNVSHDLRVTVRDITRVPEILELSVENGATNNSGVTFDVENKDKYYEQALTQALNKAIYKGNALAKSVGVDSTNVISIKENNTYYSPISYGSSEISTKDARSSVPIQNGQVTIYASVDVVIGE